MPILLFSFCFSWFPLCSSFPDVMMPAYSKNRWSCVFFIVYLSIELYFIMNLVQTALFPFLPFLEHICLLASCLMNWWVRNIVFKTDVQFVIQALISVIFSFCLQLLAVVFDTFNDVEKMKFKSLLLHKRSAIDHAFQLLVSRQVCPHCSLKCIMFCFFKEAVAPMKCLQLLVFLCWSVILFRGRWACRSNNSMAWCVFTDLGCQQGTASSHIKLLTPPGLQCSGNCRTHSLSVSRLAFNCLVTIKCSRMKWDFVLL